MGNKTSRLGSGNDSNDLEYNSAKLLLLSIKLNSKEQTVRAIELARKECVKPSHVFASVFSYDDMVKKVYEYLTQIYSIVVIENEVPRRMTPLAYANLIGSKESAQVITSSIADLTKAIKAKESQSNQNVSQTKETLKNRQSEYAYTSKGVVPPKLKPEAEKEKASVRQMMQNSNNSGDRALEAKMKLMAFQNTRKKK